MTRTHTLLDDSSELVIYWVKSVLCGEYRYGATEQLLLAGQWTALVTVQLMNGVRIQAGMRADQRRILSYEIVNKLKKTSNLGFDESFATFCVIRQFLEIW